MSTFLLTWNPSKWHWDDLSDWAAKVQRKGSASFGWSCGGTRRIRKGDRIFLLRQGVEPRGLIGSGWVTSEKPQEGEHWDDGGLPSRRALYVDVEWDVLAEDPIIRRDELEEASFAGPNWNTQASGITIEPEYARTIEAEWARRAGAGYEPLPDEVDHIEYPEGAGAYPEFCV